MEFTGRGAGGHLPGREAERILGVEQGTLRNLKSLAETRDDNGRNIKCQRDG